jgi:DNA-binding transcriptional LysR family regulator
MQHLNDMVTFARVVEAKSFSEAARRSSSSKSHMSKSIAKLERALGTRLLNRSTRGLSLTEVGAAFYEHCGRIIDEVGQAKRLVAEHQAEPRGVLKATASVAFGTLHLAPALPAFLARYPGLAVELTLSDGLVDLVEEGYDVAVRIVCAPSPNLVARELAPVRRVVCATPGYLEQHGVPQTPDDLRGHNCLSYTNSGARGEWHFTGTKGAISVPIAGTLRVNDDEALSQAVLGGLGVALLPTFIIGDALQSGRLQAVLADYLPLEKRIYAVYLQSIHITAKVRAFVTFLRERFGPEPYWDRAAETGSLRGRSPLHSHSTGSPIASAREREERGKYPSPMSAAYSATR